jgi:hypothetical protein
MLLLSAPLVLAAGAAAYGAVSNQRLERQACEFADSAASEQKRRASVDSVVALFDLEDPAVVLKADSAFTHGEPNRLERTVIMLRLEGVTAPQIYRWLTSDLRLTPAAQNERARAMDPKAQADRLRTHEMDSVYVNALASTMAVARNPWHDILHLKQLADRWAARCSTQGRGIWIFAAAFALATLALVLCWLLWLRRAPTAPSPRGPRA